MTGKAHKWRVTMQITQAKLEKSCKLQNHVLAEMCVVRFVDVVRRMAKLKNKLFSGESRRRSERNKMVCVTSFVYY